MKLANPTLLDILRLAADARPDEVEQWEAITGTRWDASAFAAEHYAKPGVKFALIDESTNLAIVAGGYELIGPGVWTSWMVGTMAHWDRHWRSITKATRRVMDDLLTQGGAKRLQTPALASRTHAGHWYMKGLGMQHEGVMRNYGANGEDVAMYARIKRV